MIKRTGLTAGAVAISLAVGLSGEASAESLTDALISAYRNSALLDATRALVRAQDESVASAVAALRPTLSLAASLSGNLTRAPGAMTAVRTTDGEVSTALSLVSELLLSDGGAGKFGVEAARSTVLAARQSLLEVEQSVLFNAASAYHDLLLKKEVLELSERGLRVIEGLLAAAKGRLEIGEGTLTDVTILEARLAASRTEVLVRQGQYEIARETYRLVTGEYPGDLVPIPALPSIPNSLEDAREISRQNHPSITKAQHTVTAAQHSLKQVEVGLVPRVYLGGNLSTNRRVGNWERGVDSASVSLTARMPLYAGGRADSAIRQRIANLERARSELEQAARVVDQGVASAWTQQQLANATIEATELQLAAEELALAAVRREADLGLRTPLDVIDSEQDMFTARSNLATARNEQSLASYSLLMSVGLMTAKHLGLGIPVYDPDTYLARVESAPAETWPATTVEDMFKALGMQ